MLRLVCLALLVAGCADLPDLGTCGNGVIEEANGEACDDGKDTDTCSASCELKCPTSRVEDYVVVRTDDTVDPHEDLYCPDATYACGLDRICRQPSGELEPASAALPFDISGAPVVADFDDDEIVDIAGASATRLLVRFGSTGEILASDASQEAPSSSSQIVMFDAANPALPSSVSVAVPTEGLALLRSDTERFAPQLDFLAMNLPADQVLRVVHDPDPALGDVIVTAATKSTTTEIAVTRQAFGVGAFPGIPQATLPPCTGVAAGAWKLEAFQVGADRKSFVVVTARETNPPAWHLCRYTPNGAAWAQTTSLELATVVPNTVVLANLDADACEELLIQSPAAVNYGRVDATGAGCDFVAGVAPVADDIAGEAQPILAAGQIIPGGLDEIVTTQGVLECASATDCTQSGGLVRRIEPSTALAWIDAAVTDVNGDGAGDVVAARLNSEDVDVVRGGSTLNVYRSDTTSKVTAVLAGDFDGDRLGDVALVETTVFGDRFTVLYGARDGVLGPARAMSEYGGKLRLHRLSSYRWLPSTLGTDGVDDILVLKNVNNAISGGISVGDAARIMTTPRFPPTINSIRDVGAVVSGRFGSSDVELLTVVDNGSSSIVQLYNVQANMWAPEVMLAADVRAPLGSLRGPNGQGNAVGLTGSETTPNLVTFSARSTQPSCATTTLSAEPRAMRGVDLDGDGVDELAVYTGEIGDRTVQVFDNTKCPATRLGEQALADCVDVARVGARLFALCRATPEGPAHLLFEIKLENGAFTRAPEPTDSLDGDGRYLAVGDYDGDGVPDLAVGVAIGSEGNIQTLKQCPAHDTRRCR